MIDSVHNAGAVWGRNSGTSAQCVTSAVESEIHGAHGYLIDQFFWAGTNQRTDRFAAEIVSAVRHALGPELSIVMRVNQWNQENSGVRLTETPALMEDWLLPLVKAGVDVLHCSQRRFWGPEFPEIDGENGLNCAGWAKKVTGATTH